jgi:transposase
MRKMQDYIIKGKEVFIGLEDSKRTWKICVRCDHQEIHRFSMPTNYSMLLSHIRNKFPQCTVSVMYEAGFKGFGLADKLRNDRIECIVTPPHTVTEEKTNKVKTDKRDARRLATNLENHDYKACFIPDRELLEDRQISRTLIGFQSDIHRVKNRIKMFLYFHDITVPFQNAKTWTPKHFAALRKLSISGSLQKMLTLMVEQLEWLSKRKSECKEALEKLSEKERYKKAFTIIKSVPGIGWFTAIRLVLEWGEDFSRFKTSKSIGNFLGLTGSEDSTGETQLKGGITHQGSPHVRSWLIECAWTAIRCDQVLLGKYKRVVASCGKTNVAIAAVARKIATRIRACVLSGKEYQIGVIA